MNPPSNSHEPNDEELTDDIVALLGDEATWAPVSDELEASIVAAVMAEVDVFKTNADPHDMPAADADAVTAAAASPTPVSSSPVSSSPEQNTSEPSNVVAFPKRWQTAALGAAAALLVVAGIFGVARVTAPGPDLERALAGTELAPEASAVAEITDTDEGTRIVITVADLPPAEPGTYYQAWLRKDAEVGVSAGTFHLRDGDGPIELWAGVSVTDYPLLTVTIQQEAQTESSGRVVLKALVVAP